MAYTVEIAPEAKKSLKKLDKSVRDRIKKKIDDIEKKITEWNVGPDVAVEKRLRAPFNQILQKRIGDYRVWFEDIREYEVLLISFVGHKKDAEERLG